MGSTSWKITRRLESKPEPDPHGARAVPARGGSWLVRLRPARLVDNTRLFLICAEVTDRERGCLCFPLSGFLIVIVSRSKSLTGSQFSPCRSAKALQLVGVHPVLGLRQLGLPGTYYGFSTA